MKKNFHIFFTLLCISSTAYSVNTQYKITSIPFEENETRVEFSEINEPGEIVGTYRKDGMVEGFVSYPFNGGRIVEGLGTVSNHGNSVATAINNQGTIVGYSHNSTDDKVAFIAFKHSGWQLKALHPMNLTESSVPYDINNRNQIVGYINNHSLFVSTNGQILETLSLDSGTFNGIPQINDSGVVLATERIDFINYPVIVSKQNLLWEENILDVPELERDRGFLKINLHNQVLAYDVISGEPNRRPYTFTVNQNNAQWQISDLEELPNSTGNSSVQYHPLDMNDAGTVVGRWSVPRGNMDPSVRGYAFVTVNGIITKLFDLVVEDRDGWTELSSAHALNNKGQIVGTGLYHGQRTAFILSPIEKNTDIVVIDGDKSDWSELLHYPDDELENLSPIDIQSLQITGDENNVYLAIHEKNFFTGGTAWARQILIDSDFNASTGFRYYDFNTGGDLLVHRNTLYKYTGNGETWEWSFVRSFPVAVNENFAELAISRNDIGSSNRFRITYYGANSLINNTPDEFHNVVVLDLNRTRSDIFIDGNSNDWSDEQMTVDQPNENIEPVDFEKVGFKQDTQYAYFAYQNRLNIDLNNIWPYLILIDTDQSISGYQYDSLRGNYLLAGNNLYQYTGNGIAWNWTYVKRVDWKAKGNFAELVIDKADLNNANDYKLLFYGANSSVNGDVDDRVYLLP